MSSKPTKPRKGRAATLCALGLFFSHVTAIAQANFVGDPRQQTRRDWWFRAPGGAYGLVEVTQSDVRSHPPLRSSSTSILIGPWRWTFAATAPQVLTVILVPTLLALGVGGWIRTRPRR